jgi:hypothetical protein
VLKKQGQCWCFHSIEGCFDHGLWKQWITRFQNELGRPGFVHFAQARRCSDHQSMVLDGHLRSKVSSETSTLTIELVSSDLT